MEPLSNMNDKTLTEFTDKLFKEDELNKLSRRASMEDFRIPSKCNRDFGEPNGWHYIAIVVACPFVLYVVLTLLLT